MYQFCLCIFTAFVVAGINAFPQDAEYIPSSISRSSYDDDEFDIVNDRSFFSPYEFAKRLFEEFTFPPFRRVAPPLPPPFYHLRPIIPRPPLIPMPPVPDFSKLPDNYDNSTQEIKYVNGKKVVVNQKTFKSKDGAGFIYSHSHSYHLAPDDQSNGAESPDHKRNETPIVAVTDHGLNETPDVAITGHGFNNTRDVVTDHELSKTPTDDIPEFGLTHIPDDEPLDDSLNQIPKVDRPSLRRKVTPVDDVPSDGSRQPINNEDSSDHRRNPSSTTRHDNGDANENSQIFP